MRIRLRSTTLNWPLSLTLELMAGFQTHISKCSERGVQLNFLFFFIGASATKMLARSRIFRYRCIGFQVYIDFIPSPYINLYKNRYQINHINEHSKPFFLFMTNFFRRNELPAPFFALILITAHHMKLFHPLIFFLRGRGGGQTLLQKKEQGRLKSRPINTVMNINMVTFDGFYVP